MFYKNNSMISYLQIKKIQIRYNKDGKNKII